MRAVRYAGADGAARIGRLEDDTIVDAGPARAIGFDASPEAWELVAAAAGRAFAARRRALLHPTRPAEADRHRPELPRPRRGVASSTSPRCRSLFAKFPRQWSATATPIVIPREETRPDYEGEVAVVIGRRTYRADADAARAAVGGISAMNDVSGRRAQLETPLRQFTLGKSFDTFAPMGPCVASRRRRRPGRDRRPDDRRPARCCRARTRAT